MAGESTLSPGPHEAPALHDSISIGSMFFPADPLEGAVKVAIKTGAELDQQKANGKDVRRTKAKGKQVAKLTLTFRFTRRIYAQSNGLRIAIDPGGDNNGRAWEIRHPECSDRRINAVMFTTMGALDATGDAFSFSVEADGWNEPAEAKVGGTKTPRTATPSPEAFDASALAQRFVHFQDVLASAGKATNAAGAGNGISSAAEAIRLAAAGKAPNPPFEGPEV